MYSTREKVNNVASVAKEKADIYKAKVEEKAEIATARTKEAKVIAVERRKAKEAQASMELHMAKAEHAAETLDHKHKHHAVGKIGKTGGTTASTHPLGGPADTGHHHK